MTADPPEGRPLALQARGLRKTYGRDVALDGIDLTVPEGSVVLLVGPNGAGKTTLLKLLLDLLPADGGQIEVLGRVPGRDGAHVRAATGFLPESVEFPFGRMRVRQVMAFHARFRPRWDEAYAARLIDILELRMDIRWKKLSKGQRRRVQLAAALAHRPSLLVLDEPTDGLDPLARETVLSLLVEHLADTGATAIYSTHVLHEAQSLADRLLVLKRGKVRVDAHVDELRDSHLRVRLRRPEEDTQSATTGAAGPGQPLPVPDFVVRQETSAGRDHIWIVRAPEAELRAWAEGVDLELIETERISMADTALGYLTGEGAR